MSLFRESTKTAKIFDTVGAGVGAIGKVVTTGLGVIKEGAGMVKGIVDAIGSGVETGKKIITAVPEVAKSYKEAFGDQTPSPTSNIEDNSNQFSRRRESFANSRQNTRDKMKENLAKRGGN